MRPLQGRGSSGVVIRGRRASRLPPAILSDAFSVRTNATVLVESTAYCFLSLRHRLRPRKRGQESNHAARRHAQDGTGSITHNAFNF